MSQIVARRLWPAALAASIFFCAMRGGAGIIAAQIQRLGRSAAGRRPAGLVAPVAPWHTSRPCHNAWRSAPAAARACRSAAFSVVGRSAGIGIGGGFGVDIGAGHVLHADMHRHGEAVDHHSRRSGVRPSTALALSIAASAAGKSFLLLAALRFGLQRLGTAGVSLGGLGLASAAIGGGAAPSRRARRQRRARRNLLVMKVVPL